MLLLMFSTQTLVCSVQVHLRATGRDVYACMLIRRRGLSLCTPLHLIAVISNQQINLLPTGLWEEPAFSIFFATCYANKTKSASKRDKTTENGSFLRDKFISFVNQSPFFIKNVCSLDQKALYMC